MHNDGPLQVLKELFSIKYECIVDSSSKLYHLLIASSFALGFFFFSRVHSFQYMEYEFFFEVSNL